MYFKCTVVYQRNGGETLQQDCTFGLVKLDLKKSIRLKILAKVLHKIGPNII